MFLNISSIVIEDLDALNELANSKTEEIIVQNLKISINNIEGFEQKK